MLAPEFGGDKLQRIDPDPYDKPVSLSGALASHSDDALHGHAISGKVRGGAFVAFHGSWNRAPRSQASYQVAFVPFDDKGMPLGTYETSPMVLPARRTSSTPMTRDSVRRSRSDQIVRCM